MSLIWEQIDQLLYLEALNKGLNSFGLFGHSPFFLFQSEIASNISEKTVN
ncbi:hypothetical protein RU98_GL003128 [Enterococcus caccae]|nr:hypothetical protein RU98_GL003128 [Enterococcus caccae]